MLTTNIFKASSVSPDWPSGVLRVSNCLIGTHAIILCVDSDYYDWTYEKRVLALNAPSIDHLCKTILFENTKWSSLSDNIYDPKNSKYYFVIVQYVDKINSTKLNNFIRSELGESLFSRKHYNLRVTPEEKALELTGFIKNAVCPIGSVQKIPLIITEKISKLDPPIACLGAGHPDYKLIIPFPELVEITNATIADLSY